MNKTPIERIDTLQMYLCLNYKAIADKIGITAQSFYDIKSGKVKSISPKLAEKIINQWNEISYDFLINGTGEISDNPIEYHAPEGAKRIVNSDLIEIIKTQECQIKDLTEQIISLSKIIAEISSKK